MDISTGHMVFTFSERYAEDENVNGDFEGALIHQDHTHQHHDHHDHQGALIHGGSPEEQAAARAGVGRTLRL